MGSLNLGVPCGQCWGSSPVATAEARSELGSLKPRLAAKSKARKYALFYKELKQLATILWVGHLLPFSSTNILLKLQSLLKHTDFLPYKGAPNYSKAPIDILKFHYLPSQFL